MENIKLPYGKCVVNMDPSGWERLYILRSGIEQYRTGYSESEIVENALASPIGAPSLAEVCRGKKRVTLVASDHTRPVPSKLIVPPLLREIRKGSPDAEITILIATGCHRATAREELTDKFGEEIVSKERIVIHDCDDSTMMTDVGRLPSGGRCIVNRLVCDTDLVVAEGFIEPHFFAGFSGGRKSILPGVSSRQTVLANHCGGFIADPGAVTGVIESNPIHRDMVWAATHVAPMWILNVILDTEKKVEAAFAGNVEAAHIAGCRFLRGLCCARAPESDIVISTNGGYPLDQNLYQSVKGMTAAEQIVRQNGVIIMLSRCSDGIGGAHFEKFISGEGTPAENFERFKRRSPQETEPDQWQAQILFRILTKARVILISDLPDEMVEKMHMIPADDLNGALEKARSMIGNPAPVLTVIPDGVSVIAEKETGGKR